MYECILIVCHHDPGFLGHHGGEVQHGAAAGVGQVQPSVPGGEGPHHLVIIITILSSYHYTDRLGGVLPVHHLGPVHGHHQRGEAAVVQHVTVRPRTQKLGHHLHL